MSKTLLTIALLSERTIKTEGGEIIRVEATPVLSDLTAHTDFKVR